MPNLDEWIKERMDSCTTVIVVRHTQPQQFEAILPISQEQIVQLVKVWTVQYYEQQVKAAQQNKNRKLAGLRKSAGKGR